MKKCKICGNYFKPNKYTPNIQKYCSKGCYTVAHRIKVRKNIKRRRRLFKHLIPDVGNTVRNGSNSLASTKIIEINGQERVEGAVILEKMVKGKLY